MSDTHQAGAGEKPPAEPTVDGITSLDFRMWRQQPVTRMFLKYLADRRDDFVAGVMDQWLGGDLQLATEDETRGYAKCLREIGTTKHEHITHFYATREAALAQLQAQAGDTADDDNDDNGAAEKGRR